jgi:putative ABC transport system permease protein
MQSLLQDLRFAARGLVRRPGFTLVVLLTLALGIGVNSTIFSIVYGVLLRPLPYAHAEQLVRLWQRRSEQGMARAPVSVPNFLDWSGQNSVFSDLGCFAPSFATLTGSGEPRELQAVRVTANLFSLLGVRPARGRGLLPGEDQPGAPPVVLVSDRLWQQLWSGRAELRDAAMVLDGVSHKVVGVMPPGFDFEEGDLWVPMVFNPTERLARGRVYLGVVGRLKPAVTLERARTDMATVASRLALDHPETNRRSEIEVVPLYEQIVGDIRPTLLVLMTAVASVLLIACANVGNLLLVQIAGRRAEIGMRIALGASRARLVRQTVTESMLLALLAGLASLLLAHWLIAWLIHLNPPKIPRLGEVRLDLPVMVFTGLVSILAGAIFGWGPALQAARSQPQALLKGGGTGLAGSAGGGLRLRNAFAVAEVALALVLLIGAGLLVRSFGRLLAVDPGFNPRHVLTGFLVLPQSRYAAASRQRLFGEQLLQRLSALPGVQGAALASSLPLGRVNSRQSFAIEGEAPATDQSPVAVVDGVSPQFFRAMGIPVLGGRTIEDRDRDPAPGVAVIDQSLADTWFPHGDAVGRRLRLPGLAADTFQIVGVVGKVKRRGLDSDSRPQIYVPLDQDMSRFVSIVLRCSTSTDALAPALRRAVWSVDPNLPVEVAALQDTLEGTLAQTRFTTRLIGVLGLIALALAVVGIYALMAYSVACRRHEIGVRMAMGGQKGQILGLVMRQALVLTAVGLALGALSALAVTRLAAGLLFGVTPTDPVTFITVPLLLGGVAIAASYLPARRATRVDPVIALRSE